MFEYGTLVKTSAGTAGAFQQPQQPLSLESPAYAGLKQQSAEATSAEAPDSVRHSQVVSQQGAASGQQLEYTYDYDVDAE